MTLQDALEQFIADANARGLSPDTVQQEGAAMSLRSAIEAFLLAVEADCSPATVETHRYRLVRLNTALGARPVSDVTVEELRRYVVGLRDEPRLGPTTVHGHVRSLKRLFSWLVSEGILSPEANPAQRIRLPRLPDVPPKGIAIEDVRKLLAAAMEMGQEWERRRNLAILLFLADTGCRLQGVAGLSLSDLDLRGRTAIVREKMQQWRFVFLKPVVVEALEQWLEVRGQVAGPKAGNAVWVSRRGTPLTRWGIQNMLKRLKKRAGVTGPASAHAFRHGFAINYLLNGGDLATLADLLGHKDIETTKRYYARFRQDQLREQHDRYSPVDDLLPWSAGLRSQWPAFESRRGYLEKAAQAACGKRQPAE